MAEDDGGAFALVEIGDLDAADGELLHAARSPKSEHHALEVGQPAASARGAGFPQ